MREFAAFTMRSPYHAMALAGLFGVLSLIFLPLAVLSVACLALVVLRMGWHAGVVLIFGALLPVLLAWWLIPLKAVFPFPPILALWAATLIAAEMLRRTESQGLAAVVMTVMGVLVVLVLRLSTGDPAEFWQGERVSEAVGAVPTMTEDDLRGVGAPPRLLGGLLALLSATVGFCGLLLARWWQSLLYNPGGFGPEFRRLQLPRLALPVTAVAMLAAGQIDTTLLDDLFLASLLMYYFTGLAVIHAIAHKRRLSVGWLVPLYVALLIMPQFTLVGLAFLGALDVVVHFRGRPKRV